jgi:hypothetical protein
VPATFALLEAAKRRPAPVPPPPSDDGLRALFDAPELAKLDAAAADAPSSAPTISPAPVRPPRQYGSRDALAYVAYRMAPIYGSVHRVLRVRAHHVTTSQKGGSACWLVGVVVAGLA